MNISHAMTSTRSSLIHCCYGLGTYVIQGSGKMVVTAVGINSQTGIIVHLLGATDEECKGVEEEEGSSEYSSEASGDADDWDGSKPLTEKEGKQKKEKEEKLKKKKKKKSRKRKSVLQEKLTRLALHIGYAGKTYDSTASYTYLVL